MSKFMFGCDPEIFIRKAGKAVSAHGVVPGSKTAPFKVEGGAIQVDGTALELNTDPVPLVSFAEFDKKLVSVLRELKAKAQQVDPEFNFAIIPVQEYPQEYLDSLPDDAKELGCDPDYNAYTLEENPRPDGDRPFRTGAGHIHVGWGADIPVDNRQHHEICASFVKMLDATVGMFMVVIDSDNRRRELYGKAGAYRAKPYGVEYRYPSNVWLRNRSFRKAVFQLTLVAVQRMQAGYTTERVTGVSSEEIQRILNEGDYNPAYNILRIVAPYDYSTTIAREIYNQRCAGTYKG